MLVVHLVFSSIYLAIVGLESLDELKSIGLRTIGFYMLTTALAVTLAILAMNFFPIGEVTSSAGLDYEKASQISKNTFNFLDFFKIFLSTCQE